jgi:2-dehydropantoate 2-reductase
LKVIKAAGIKTADVQGFPIEPIETMARESVPIASTLLKKIAESLGKVPVLGSTLQSIKRGTSTEVDYLNGEIVNLGKKRGIPTPVNSLIVELVHHVETTRRFLTVDEITQRLR